MKLIQTVFFTCKFKSKHFMNSNISKILTHIFIVKYSKTSYVIRAKIFRFVYFVMEFCAGGELFSLLLHANSFDDNMARFYSGCVIEALGFLHSKRIIFRDLKVSASLICNKDNRLLISKKMCRRD